MHYGISHSFLEAVQAVTVVISNFKCGQIPGIFLSLTPYMVVIYECLLSLRILLT